MSHMLRMKVETLIRRHRMLVPGDGVVVACSGGADSLTLLGMLVALRADYNLRLTAVYIDHGLRPEAGEEGEYVKHIAARWGVPALVRRVEKDLHVPGQSVQELARLERYRLLDEVAHQLGAARIATGHTADDQAETLVMRFVRGTGSHGLAGILPVVGRVIRPLLLVRRDETEAYCARQKIVPVHDPSNDEDVYLRNRIRHHLIPELLALNPQFVEAMLNLAETARGENEWIELEVSELLNKAIPTDGGWWMSMDVFHDQPLGLQRRALRALLRRFDLGSEPDFDHIESIRDMLRRSRTGSRVCLPHGLVVWMEKEGFWVGPKAPIVEFEDVVPLPGRIRIPNSDLCLVTSIRAGGLDSVSEVKHWQTDSQRPWDPEGRSVVLDRERIIGCLRVRNWHPGDRYCPLGMYGEKKLQDMFVDEGVPQRWRRRLPVVVDDQGILWVPGARPADRAKVTSATRMLFAFSVCKSDA